MRGQREIYINLLNYKLKSEQIKNHKLKGLAIYILIAVLIMSAAGTATIIKTKQLAELQASNKQLEEQIAKNQASSLSLVSQEKLNNEIEYRGKLVNQLENNKRNYGSVYADIGERDRPGILLTNISIKPGNIAFKGYANSPDQLVQFVDWLKKGPYYEEISELGSQANEATGEVSFNITAGLGASAR